LVVTEDILRIANAIPDYDVERELGRGGMGIVFFGRHRRLLRGAAIKELPPSISIEEQVRERFATEAQILAGLAHPHIVPIFDYVERDGECLIVMEELPGGSVWDRFTSEGLTPPTACAVVMAACAALQHAHDRGVLHLDMKPDNLMFDLQSAVKVTDFGISQVITGGRTMGTVDGQVLGTPAYMSPEQARGEQLTAASDVYAAGVMLYELLSGQLPWHGATTAAELLQQRLAEDPIPISEQAPHVPPAIAEVVMRSIARDVDDRFQGAEDFGVAIGEACARSWGPTWIDQAGVAIVGSEKLSLAARTTTHLGVAPVDGAALGAEVLDLTDPPARPTVAPPGAAVTGGGPFAAPATGAVTPAARSAPATGAVAPAATDLDGGDTAEPAPELEFDVIRASTADPRISGVDLYGLELADLINVRDVLSPPGTPWRPILLAGVLFAGAALVGAIGLGSHGRAGTIEAGQVLLDGVDVTTDERITIDLSRDVAVDVTDPTLAGAADEVEVEFHYLDATAPGASAALRDGRAVLEPGFAQRAVGGATEADVRLLSRGEVVAHREVGVDAAQSRFLTAPFAFGVFLLLLAYAELETTLRPLRSGHTRVRSYAGAVLWCPVLAMGALFVLVAFGTNELAEVDIAVAGALSALGAIALVRARTGVARRRRVRTAVKRAERRLQMDQKSHFTPL